MISRRISSRLIALVVAALALALLPAGARASDPPASYRNPITTPYSIDFPDPTVMRGKDGYWYAYSTGGPYDEQGAASDASKIARSADLVHWERVGPIFTADTWPTWAAPTTGFWAPDIRYLNGTYVMYFTVPDTTVSDEGFDAGIGVATAPTPAGPWTDSGAPLIPPRQVGGGWTTVIDPAGFTDDDGSQYLYYGGYGSGSFVVPLSEDGLSVTGEGKPVLSPRFEGIYVIKRNDWYYAFGSSANCCAGPTTGYTLFAGRARSPFGPFLDRDGVSMLQSRSGGTIVIAPNGNRWIGTGHGSMVTDLAGQTWQAYHAIDRNDPYLDVSPGFTMRPMLLDRMDWIDGWPTVRGGWWASDSPQPAPVTTGIVDDRFDSADETANRFRTLSGELRVHADDPASDSGGYAELVGDTTAVAPIRTPRDVRVEADVRASEGTATAGVALRRQADGAGVEVSVQAGSNVLQALVEGSNDGVATAVPLPDNVDLGVWHNLAVEVRGARLVAELSDARLGDPIATLELQLPPRLLLPGKAGIAGADGAVDNVSVAALFRPHTARAPEPVPGAELPAYSDDFDGALGDGWTWRNENPDAQVVDGELAWPTELADLTGDTAPNAGLLLRTPPAGDYTVETKLTIDLGVDTNRNYQQAGLLVYLDDKHFLRLDHVAVGSTRFVEFGKRMTWPDSAGDLVPWGAAIIGPPAETTWLRIVKTTDPATGEQRYRAGSSTDGSRWIYGATWTLPAGVAPRIGLVSQGSSAATEEAFGKATAHFDYFTVYDD